MVTVEVPRCWASLLSIAKFGPGVKRLGPRQRMAVDNPTPFIWDSRTVEFEHPTKGPAYLDLNSNDFDYWLDAYALFDENGGLTLLDLVDGQVLTVCGVEVQVKLV